jgi:hypothetical protein
MNATGNTRPGNKPGAGEALERAIDLLGRAVDSGRMARGTALGIGDSLRILHAIGESRWKQPTRVKLVAQVVRFLRQINAPSALIIPLAEQLDRARRALRHEARQKRAAASKRAKKAPVATPAPSPAPIHAESQPPLAAQVEQAPAVEGQLQATDLGESKP